MHKYLLEVKTTLIDYYYSLHTLRFLYISFIRQILFAFCTLPSSVFLPLTNQSEAAKVFKCMTDMGSVVSNLAQKYQECPVATLWQMLHFIHYFFTEYISFFFMFGVQLLKLWQELQKEKKTAIGNQMRNECR